MEKWTWGCLTILVATGGCGSTEPETMVHHVVLFEDVSQESGIVHTGLTSALAVADFDNDGWEDVYSAHHFYGEPHLYRNLAGRKFENVYREATGKKNDGRDRHGAAWADYDNDGDQDLIQVCGGQRGLGEVPNEFFRNENNRLVDITDDVGIANPLSRSYTVLWTDLDLNGRLDVISVAPPRRDELTVASSAFLQGQTRFENRTEQLGLHHREKGHAQVTCLLGNDQRYLVMHGKKRVDFYRIAADGNLTLDEDIFLPLERNTLSGSVMADFDGDLLPDLLAIYAAPRGDRMHKFKKGFRVHLNGTDRDKPEKVLAFRCSGDPVVELNYLVRNREDKSQRVFIGAAGTAPDGKPTRVRQTIPLSRSHPDHVGIAEHSRDGSAKYYLGYNPGKSRWEIHFSNATANDNVTVTVTSDAGIPDIETINFQPRPADQGDFGFVYYNQGDGTFRSEHRPGIRLNSDCQGIAMGDFDNDSDMDIYLVLGDRVANHANQIYLNDGKGRFSPVASSGGEGSGEGSGDAAVVFDFNNDGLLDLFVNNGRRHRHGPAQLFRNVCAAGNHWLQIELQGDAATGRDGNGARVFLTAGGKVQVREQNGGVVGNSQSTRRLHFGLGRSPTVEKIVVVWPSGTKQVLTHVTADQLLRIQPPQNVAGSR